MKVFLLLLIFFAIKANAFPDTIRHGYVNCSSCHVSPSGGGIMNNYGRSLSRELLSTWGNENEEKLLNGLLKLPDDVLEKFLIGGDARYISRRQKSEISQVDEGFWMQAQLRLGWAVDKFKVLMAAGKIENPRVSQEVRYVSPEYYILYSPQESIYFRIGRFEPVFGLRMPDHSLLIKSDLGFSPWNERDSLEFMYEGESQFLSLSGFQSTSAVSATMQTTGYSFNFDQAILDTTRVGVSAMNFEGQGVRQKILGGHGVISWSDKLFTLFDYSRLWNLDTVKDVNLLRTGFEFFKGVTPYLQTQERIDLTGNGNSQKKYGAGVIWLPRPHFEMILQFEKSESRRGVSEENYFLMHYYL